MLFSALPGVQPVTVVAVVAGVALGLRAGVATGAIAAFVSNLFLGQGIWTPQQMLGWAACGAVGALLAPVLRTGSRSPPSASCSASLFSASMDLWLWYGFFPHTWAVADRRARPGRWFDLSHAIGNVVLVLAIGPELRRMLDRYRSRLRTVVVWA